MTKRYQDESWLRHQYLVEGRTTREIARLCDCDNSTISRWLNEHNIPTRDNWRAGVERAKEVNRQGFARLRSLPKGYEYWASKEGDERINRIVYVHRLLAVSEHGFDAVAGKSVHHKNGVKWDNRPGNLELMTRSEHQNEHRQGTEYRNGSYVEVES